MSILSATLAARDRTGDKGIATQVHRGKWRVVRVTFITNGRRRTHVEPLSDWIPQSAVESVLDAMMPA